MSEPQPQAEVLRTGNNLEKWAHAREQNNAFDRGYRCAMLDASETLRQRYERLIDEESSVP